MVTGLRFPDGAVVQMTFYPIEFWGIELLVGGSCICTQRTICSSN